MKILAIDIGGTAIKSALTDEKGQISELKEIETNGKEGAQLVIDKAIEIARSYEGFEAIGISTTGQVNVEEGSIIFAGEAIVGYTGMHVRSQFEEAFHLPVIVENDVNAAAIGETQFGAGRDYTNMLCITYGTGVGGAIVINRKVYRGSTGLAGEFGHIVTHPSGKTCACGQDGCYEQYASTTALVREAKRLDKGLLNGRLIFDEWHKGNMEIKNVVDNWIDEIVFGLVTLIHIFNPNGIVLGGGILNESYIENEINKRIYRRVMPSYSAFKIVKAELKNTAGLLGAAYSVYHMVQKQNKKK